ncbi:hypothetical protein PsaNZ64_27610 [Pseudomonas syringae pv. actinidiae]|uniref:Uncharacterized protein n=1 Tax=Pseudomonas syringae pv. actinidiae TaxID=103796 RepID=A0A2P0QFZ5_PSESF|nr:hypothetical protein [Pseudomonas syringae]ARO45316.1 hypothetical protein [Pseudomonas syringae pv. actinidiae]OKS65388.1 hypothetical protein PsaNZ64_27610 [Pseudomonas syringae pv. actinidiae]
MDKDDLKHLEYLATRLERAAPERGELRDAAQLVRKVMANLEVMRGEAEHAFYWSLWSYLSVAIDHDDFDPIYELDVQALELEMAGRVLIYRQGRGWLTKAPGSPTLEDLKTIDDFL